MDTLGSVTGDGHLADPEGGCHDAAPEDQVVSDHLDPEHHLLEIARDGDLLDRIGHLPLIDPEPHSATGLIAGDEVPAGADQLGDVRRRIY